MTTPTPALVALGDVVFDAYANPAVIVRVEMRGTPYERYSIMQTTGSDRGRVTSCPTDASGRPYRVHGFSEAKREVVRAVVRAEARRQGWKWDAQGITR